MGNDDGRRFNFTMTAISALPIPRRIDAKKAVRVTYRDTEIPGLELRISDSGVKTFSVRRRVKNGGVERVTIGKFSSNGSGITVKKAREEAQKHGAAFAVGDSPAAVRRKQKSDLTLKQARTFIDNNGSSWTAV